MPAKTAIRWTGDDEADRLLARDPLALLIGMLLDQQVPMERAFRSPYDLKERLGGRLDAAEIASADPDELRAVFSERPALHRFPGSMADRTRALCQLLVDDYGGGAEAVWKGATTGRELYDRIRALPGFGDGKARIFVAVLAKQLGVTPPGHEEFMAVHPSVADVDGPDSLAELREWKRAAKAKAKAKSEG